MSVVKEPAPDPTSSKAQDNTFSARQSYPVVPRKNYD